MIRIRIARVPPTVSAWVLARLTQTVAPRADIARTNVPKVSSMIPIVGSTLAASFVEPKLVASPNGANTSLSVRPASIPPAVWDMMYGITRFPLRSRAEAAASVSAGLITAPECSPRRMMIAPTVPPKVRATSRSATGVEDSENSETRTIDDGPTTTRT